MNVLILNPPVDRERFGEFGIFLEAFPPMTLAYTASILKEKHTVTVVDAFSENISKQEVISRAKKINPDTILIGIPCLAPALIPSFKIGRKLKGEIDSTVVLLDMNSDFLIKESLENEFADVVVKRETEAVIKSLIDAIEKENNLKNIPNVAYKKNGEIIYSDKVKFLNDIDDLPYPSWDLFSYKNHGILPFGNVEKPIIGMEASRGCPYNCNFCSPVNLTKDYRMRDPVKVVDEMEFLVKEYDVNQIAFMDLIFPFKKKFVRKFSNEIIDRDLQKEIVWTCETRADLFDKESFQMMSKGGCERIMFGVESGSQKMLDKLNKDSKVKEVIRGVQKANEAGIGTVGFFMIGLPGEDEEDIIKTINFSKKLSLDFAKFAIFLPVPGTDIFKNLVKKSDIDPSEFKVENWDNFSTWLSSKQKNLYLPKGLTSEKLKELQEKANFEFYFRPKKMLNLVKSLNYKELMKAGHLFIKNWWK